MTTKPSTFARLSRTFAFFAAATMALPLFADMPVPVAVWDGASVAHDFSSLSQTSGGFTYTLNLNSMNTRAADNSYIQIGNQNAEKAVTITADTSGAFGTAGALTVIMRCEEMPVSLGSNRAIIALSDGKKYKKGGTDDPDNSAFIGMYINNGSSGWIWGGSIADWSLSGEHISKVSGAFSSADQIVAYTYSSSGGSAYYVNGVQKQSDSGLKASTFTTPQAILLGGVDVDGSSQFFALTGMKIKAVAIFTSTLNADQVASYSSSGFPSYANVTVSSDTNVSAINAAASASEIYVTVADGVTITGDTTFTASTVHFYCDGSFNLVPPAENTATFDFENVSGRPRIVYSGTLPSVTGDKFTATSIPEFVTNESLWKGTIWLKNVAVTDFETNPYGNDLSVVRLTGVTGWLKAPGNYAYVNSVPVELINTGANNSLALYVDDGIPASSTYPNRCSVFKKILGDGTLRTGEQSKGALTVLVIQDTSEYTGALQANYSKVIVVGETMPAFERLVTAAIFVMEGASYKVAKNVCYATGGKIFVDGELRTSTLDFIGGGTSIVTSDTGVFTLTSTGSPANDNETVSSYSRITGTGSIKYEGAGWRPLSTNNFPKAMTLVNEQAGDLVLSRATTYTNGSFSGSCNIEGNYGSGDRYLRILQSKDTEWSGKIKDDSSNRFKGLYVSTGASSSGTLTLSGAQTYSAALTVESGAKVNLTGTWVGATTVADTGTIGGQGLISGSLTLGDYTVVKRTAEGPLRVSGTVTAAAASTIVVDMSDATPSEGMQVMTWSTQPAAETFKFKNGDSTVDTVTGGGKSYYLKKESSALVLKSTSVEATGLTFTTIGVDLTNSTVTVVVPTREFSEGNISGTLTSFKLFVDGIENDGVVGSLVGDTVTFNNVALPYPGDGSGTNVNFVTYSIFGITDGGTSIEIAGDPAKIPHYGTFAVGERAVRIDENYSTTGTAAAGGAWATGVTYDGATHSAGITNNTFNINAGNYLTNDIVTVTTKLKYDSPMGVDVPVEPAPVAAYTLGFDDSVNFTFKVYSTDAGGDPAWIEVSNAGLTPDTNVDYVATMTMNMYRGVFLLNINGYDLADSAGNTEFAMPDRTIKRIKEIAFDGEGNVTYIKGEDKLCFMVEDATGKRFVSVDDAIAAYYLRQATEPLTLLHGTDPDGLPVGWTGSSAGDTLTLNAVYAVYDTDGSLWAKYATLTNAVAFAPNNSTNKLLKAATESTIAVLDAPGHNLTLDLQTYTLTYDAPVTGAAMIDIGRGASMKILRGAGGTIAHGTTAGPFFNVAYRGYLDEDIGSDPVKGTDYTLGDMMYKHKSKEAGAPATRYVFERRTGFLMINK